MIHWLADFTSTEKSLDVVLLGNGSTLAKCGPLASDGLMAWGRFINNEFERACLVRGQELETSDGSSS